MATSLDELPEPTVPEEAPVPAPVEVPPTPPAEFPAPPAVTDPASVPGPEPPVATAPAVPLFYCLSNDHSWHQKDESRFFGYEGEGCPTCPQCNKQVTAVPVNALGEYPTVVTKGV